MPLTINVGLSRKASRQFQSRGASINVTADLDQTLLRKPKQLQKEIAKLYEHADAALQRQIPARADAAAAASTNGCVERAGPRERAMTAAQRRTIDAIAARLQTDAEAEARECLGLPLDALTAPQASRLIAHLQSRGPCVRQ